MLNMVITAIAINNSMMLRNLKQPVHPPKSIYTWHGKTGTNDFLNGFRNHLKNTGIYINDTSTYNVCYSLLVLSVYSLVG